MHACTRGLLIGVGLSAASSSALGASVTLHGTGFDASGNPLPSSSISGGVDGSWTVGGNSAFFIAPGNANWWAGGGIAAFAYAPNTNKATFGGSGWISNNASSDFNGPAPYTFSTHFDLSDFDLETVSISGQWSLADGGTLSVNGHVVSTLDMGIRPETSLHSFSLSGPALLKAGQNTLSIAVTQSDQFFEAARFEGTVSGRVIPEPATPNILGTGLLAVGVLTRLARRHRSLGVVSPPGQRSPEPLASLT